MVTFRIAAVGVCLGVGGCASSVDDIDRPGLATDSEGEGSEAGGGGDGSAEPSTSADTSTSTSAGDDGPTTASDDEGPGGGSSGGGEETSGSTGEPVPEGPIIWSNDFDDEPVGAYSDATFAEGWNDPTWEQGVSDGRVEVIEGPDAFDGRSLRVHYPGGAYGGTDSGAQWWLELPERYDELWLSYRVRMDPGFQFVLGGKLPGLIGGQLNEGTVPDGENGWTARGAWGPDGIALQHLYHMDQDDEWGDFPEWDEGGGQSFVAGQWTRIDHHVRMNTPGSADGVLETWLDGQLAMRLEGLRFRTTDALGIDRMFFSTFFGGSSAQWAPGSDRTIDFDDFVISEEPIE